MAPPKDPSHAADDLYKAMKGLGTNEKLIIATIAGMDTETIAQTKEIFFQKYKHDLIKEIKSETSGHFETLCVGILTDPIEYDSYLLYNAMHGLGTKDHQLIEVLASRHPDHLKKVARIFTTHHNKGLEDWIAADTSGDYCQYLLALAGGNRDPNNTPVDKAKVDDDVQRLYAAGEGRLGTDEKVWVEIFAHRSWKHMRHVVDEYQLKHTHSLFSAIKGEFSSELKDALQWSVEFFEDKHLFFAKRLRASMQGLGTRDDDLCRIMISRRDVDLY